MQRRPSDLGGDLEGASPQTLSAGQSPVVRAEEGTTVPGANVKVERDAEGRRIRSRSPASGKASPGSTRGLSPSQRSSRPSIDESADIRRRSGPSTPVDVAGRSAIGRPPPTGPRGLYSGGPSSGRRQEPPPRSLSRKVDLQGAPLAPGGFPVISQESPLLQVPDAPRGSITAAPPASSSTPAQDPFRPNQGPRVSSSGPSTPLASAPPAAATPTSKVRAPFTASDFPSSINPELEAEVANLSSSRLAASCSHKLQSTSVALRAALGELAEVEVELAGARLKTTVTENSLDKLREEFEAYTVEAGRAEAKSISEPWLVDV
ncbi:hypothetical protein FA10DRAFT_264451 [Acaromyces ingoldii]|uniref:Uncharacterized protein n=1 Tax=Acaromyces ingoldii TaxID=215250 RepID=A0A316YYY6_9BASI|nr:hypothetical protein FA10DRAFT_264451 [Acaromyces ingoldii]PWN93858.1 hypothetical protein FA10DRAFT_264451 [Acaromyces ingoldii]